MKRLLDVLTATDQFFAKKQVPQPRLQAECLLAHGLGISRLQIYLQHERVLEESELVRLREIVTRRAQREPLQHILGTVCFCGLELACDSRALIPRPETEILVETLWKQFDANSEGLLWDIGTGSGAIVLAFLHQRPLWKGVATDSSEKALALAAENAQRTHLAERVMFQHISGWPKESGSPQAIATNLPYLPHDQMASLSPEVLCDPLDALDGGGDGLDAYRTLLSSPDPRMTAGTPLIMEFGDGQHEAVVDLLEAGGWEGTRIIPDLTGKPRHALAIRRS